MTTGELTDSLRETIAVFDESGVPRTTPEVADLLDLGRRSTYNRLERLVEHDRLETKKVGANARVWWRPKETHGVAVPDWSAAAESLIDDVLYDVEIGIFVLDEDFNVTWINAATERYFGLDHERVLGRDKRRLVDDRIASIVEDADAFTETVLATYDDNTYTEQFECHVTAGEERKARWLEHRSKPIETGAYAGGRVELYYDVTDQHVAQARRLGRPQGQFVNEVFARIDEAFFGLDEDWQFTYVNDRAADLVRLPPRKLVGAKIWDVLHELADSDLRAVAERAMETQEPFEIEFYSELLEIWLEIRGYPSETGLSAYVRDVTERKERELELEEYERIVETVDDGIYVLDEQGHIQRMNDAFVSMTQYDREELLGMHASEIFGEKFDDLDSKARRQFASEGTDLAEFEENIYTATNDTVTVESRFTRLEVEEGEGRVGVVRDITERKQFEDTLTALYDSARDLLAADSKDEVSEIVVETLTDVLDLPGVVMFQYDEDANELSPTARLIESEFIHQRLQSVPADGSSIVGKSFVEGDTHNFDNVWGAPNVQLDDDTTEMEAGLFVPVGDNGVFVVGTRSKEGFDHKTKLLVELLAANAEGVYERVERERALEESGRQYRTLVENFPNGAVILFDEDLEYLIAGGEAFEGLDVSVEDLEGDTIAERLPAELMDTFLPRYRAVFEGQASEFEFEFNDQIRQFQVVPVRDESGSVFAGLAISQDVTQHREHERELKRQREQLTALNNLNDIVRNITDAVIDQSTREEIEATVCERLAASDSYEFAWIAEVDSQSIIPRFEAGVDGYLEEISLSTNPDEPVGWGPAGRAIRTRETQITRNALSDPDFEPWRDNAKRYGYRSAAGIPITHEGTLYGLLGVYADRPNAFEAQEQEVIGQLGEIVGHAIASVERKQALTSDEITELEFTVPDVAELAGLEMDIDGTISFDRAVSIGDGAYLEYGTVDSDAIDTLEALVDRLDHFDEVTIVDREADTVRFELRLSEPPVVSIMASHGGYMQQAMIEDGDFHLTVHFPVTVDARRIIDAVQDAYPRTDLLRRRQTMRSNDSVAQIHRAVAGELTDRQRATLEAAYQSGFFEWPRNATGEEIAESLGIAPSTFSHHLRKGQQKVFEELFSTSTPS